MKRRRKISFEDLVLENKHELMKDQEAIERIEAKLEKRHLQKAE
ncbi:FbpB family small basic protein [Bacillus sp. 1P06AnD]